MLELQLVTNPNPILEQEMQDFDFANPVMDPAELELAMCRLMAERNGIGLAANQVGLNSRVFVIKTQQLEGVIMPFAVFNPKILAVGDETVLDYEGCLSFPRLYLSVKRPKSIVTEFLDRDGKQCIITLHDIDARCFLHEFDHLNGVCFTDRVSKLKLDMARKRQRKLDGRTK